MAEEDPLAEYVEANRDRFTPEALDRRMREAGHPPAVIDAAIGRSVPPPAPTFRKVSVFWPPRSGGRTRAGQALIALAHVALFLLVAWWYASSMSLVGALIAGVLLAFGVGSAWLLAMTAYGESSAKLARDNLIAAFAAALVAPIAVLVVLTGICVAVSRPIDWITGGLP
jgi:hypothetical protein